jgi:tartrate/fumarate subfamily iron-sulfur-dependent hydro-lyase beta chain
MKEISTPVGEEIRKLRAGSLVSLTGVLFTARDRTYRRILETLDRGGKLPVDLVGQALYHCGPLVRKVGGEYRVLSCGPTTSSRLDDLHAEVLRKTGARLMIGKGGIGPQAAREVATLGCVYLSFTGGAGALAASFVKRVRGVYWEELGPEAMWLLEVEGFGPLVVMVDTRGETFGEHSRVVERLIDYSGHEEELSPRTIKDVERALEDVKKGRTYSTSEVRKRLR